MATTQTRLHHHLGELCVRTRDPPYFFTLPLVLWPFIGRAVEIERVSRLLRDGLFAGSIVLGAIGVGKTRFAEELASRLAGLGQPLVRVQGTETAKAIPFGATAHLLAGAPPAPAQHDLITAAVQMLAGRAQQGRRTVLIVDDAPLLDDASLTLVHAAVTGGHCTLVATARDGSDMPETVHRWWRDEHCARVDLGPLTEDETDELLTRISERPLSEAARSRLWQLSRGVPLYLRELLAAGEPDGAVVAPLLVDLVATRFNGLDASTSRLMHAVAIGEPLALDFVATHDWLEAAAELERRGLIDTRDDELVVSHPIYREVVSASMPALERRATSRALIDFVKDREDGQAPDHLRLAMWMLDAGVADGSAMAAGARVALSRFDANLALRLADASLAVMDSSPARRARGEALQLLGDLAAADPELRAAVDLATSEAERVEAVLTLGRQLVVLEGRHEDARLALEEARLAFDGEWPRAAISDLLALNALLNDSLDVVAEQSLAELDSRARGLPCGGTYLAASTSLIHSLQLTRAAELHARPRETYLDNATDPLGPLASTLVLSNDVWLELVRGRPKLGERIARQTLREATLAGATAAVGVMTMTLATALVVQGAINRARAAIEETRSLLERSDATGSLPSAINLAAYYACLGGEPELADEVVGRERAPDSWDNRDQLYVAGALAYVDLATGAPDALARSLALIESMQSRANRATASLVLNDLVRAGQATIATPIFADIAARSDSPVITALSARASAFAREDAKALEVLADELEALGWNLDAAEAAATAARLHAENGSRADERRARARAGHLASLCPGARTPLLGDLAPGPLTPREREIASLAASLSNREIAERLNVSVRTVENHLAAVYRKLGITGRDELPAVD